MKDDIQHKKISEDLDVLMDVTRAGVYGEPTLNDLQSKIHILAHIVKALQCSLLSRTEYLEDSINDAELRIEDVRNELMCISVRRR